MLERSSRVVALKRPVPAHLAGGSPFSAAICRLLDALGHAALLFDARGTLLDVSHGYRAMATSAADDLMLRREARNLALREPLVQRSEARRVGGPESSTVARFVGSGADVPEMRIHAGRFSLRRLQVSLCGGGGGEQADVVAVLVDAAPDGCDLNEALRGRCGLTPREATVALLIADGLSTPRIAAALGVSLHTVRRHSERIFRKLGVTTRAAVSRYVLTVGARIEERRPAAPGADP